MKTLSPDEVETSPKSPNKPLLGTVHYIVNGESYDIPREMAPRFERENPDAKVGSSPTNPGTASNQIPAQSVLIRKGNGQPITRQTAAHYLVNAGGDTDRARSMAKKDGWLVADSDSSGPVTIKPGEAIAANPNGDRAVIRAGKWVDARTGTPIGPEGEHFTPDTHVFSASRWQAANPKGDLKRAKDLAVAKGYTVTK